MKENKYPNAKPQIDRLSKIFKAEIEKNKELYKLWEKINIGDLQIKLEDVYDYFKECDGNFEEMLEEIDLVIFLSFLVKLKLHQYLEEVEQ